MKRPRTSTRPKIHPEAEAEMRRLDIWDLPWECDTYPTERGGWTNGGAIARLRFWETEIRLFNAFPEEFGAKLYDGAGRNIGWLIYDEDGPCERWEHYFGCARAWYAGVREQQELKPNTKGKRTK